ncbi:speckle-type POZ protein A-like [Trichogramma pretiosum]|uniref:speckle-type POZ protein A-like n=1 Tax=Trichogramma pretiosum TaxID=7493 RepID=UPI0006C974FC|nr:speckle-type POZ protein A-like [Trichogramma pretiosum]
MWTKSVCLELHCIEIVETLPCQYKISMIRDDRIIETFTDDAHSTNATVREPIFNIIPEQFKRFISSTGTVIIRCELTLAIGVRKDFLSDESIDTYAVSVPKYHFDGIYLDKNLSDVKLRSSCGKEIPAHRIVLAAASPVFKAMFNHDMLENKTQSVDMNDISYDTAVEMLRYIYTGAVKNHEIPFIIDLSAAADKYQLESLKNKCEQILGSKLSAENAIVILKVADKYSMKNLKQKAVDFVKSNIIDSANPDKAGTMILSMAEFLSK